MDADIDLTLVTVTVTPIGIHARSRGIRCPRRARLSTQGASEHLPPVLSLANVNLVEPHGNEYPFGPISVSSVDSGHGHWPQAGHLLGQ
jgi:hypothetical protein